MEPEAFLFPLGPLREALFPDDDVGAALAAWIGQAEERAAAAGVAADGPEARAYVLHLAYRALCEGGGSRAVKRQQVEGEGMVEYASGGPDFCALADRYGAEAGAVATGRRAGYAIVRSLR